MRRAHGGGVRSTDRAIRLAGLGFGLSALCSAGLGVTYWLGGQPQAEGALIAGSLGGLAFGFIMWAKYLLPAGPYVEERHPVGSSGLERAVFESDLAEDDQTIGRRSFLVRMLLLALGALGIASIFPIRSLGPKPGGALFRTSWRRGRRLVTEAGTPVRMGELATGGVITVFPEGHVNAADSQVLLIHVAPSDLRPLPGRESWAPDGHVAYSKICTHAGCPVGLYEQASKRLFCPCHQSVFDVLDGARPTAGPATRPLPQLPLSVDSEGFFEAQGDFSEPVGPAFWNLP